MNNGFVTTVCICPGALLYAIYFHCKCVTVNSAFSLFSDESKLSSVQINMPIEVDLF